MDREDGQHVENKYTNTCLFGRNNFLLLTYFLLTTCTMRPVGEGSLEHVCNTICMYIYGMLNMNVQAILAHRQSGKHTATGTTSQSALTHTYTSISINPYVVCQSALTHTYMSISINPYIMCQAALTHT